MDYKGKLYKISDTEHVSDKFMKREFVLLETWTTRFGENENFLPFQLTQQNVGQLDGFKIGDEVDVKFNMDGNLWKKDENSEERCFVNLTAYSVVKIVATGEAKKPEKKVQVTATPVTAPPDPAPTDINAGATDDNGDLPF